jgi:glycosyltransferase involved in cell wall biosynthesis
VRVANRIAAAMPNVLSVVVGSDRTAYGNDLKHIATRSFREHVLATERPDVRRFRFLGTVEASTLVDVLSLSDLHVSLTVPFVLSWSLLDALACECVVLASATAPVREVIDAGVTGLLADFFDVDGLAVRALQVLKARWRTGDSAPRDAHSSTSATASSARFRASYQCSGR